MAFDAEFLNGVFGNEDTTIEQKVQTIIDEHNASERGLVQKRDELLGNQKKLKEQITGYESKDAEYEQKIAGLEQQLQANNPDERRKYYESQVDSINKKHSVEMDALTKERDFYRSSHYEMLKSNAINEGIKDFQFIDGLKDGFVASVMYRNQFEPRDIDGQIIFLNKANKTIPEVMKEFATTIEGKAYIKNPSSGGGAFNTSSQSVSGGTKMTRADYDAMAKNNPQALREFFQKGGQILD